MSTAIVTVRTHTGNETDVEIPAEIPCKEVVRLLQAGLSCPGEDLVLFAPDLGRRLGDEETLSEADVRVGFRLHLEPRGAAHGAVDSEGPTRGWRALADDGAAAPRAAEPPAAAPPPAEGYKFKRVE